MVVIQNKYDAKYGLRRQYGTIKSAAKQLKISYFNLSRILNGQPCTIDVYVKIMIACDYLPKKKYHIPALDCITFLKCNNLSLKTRLI